MTRKPKLPVLPPTQEAPPAPDPGTREGWLRSLARRQVSTRWAVAVVLVFALAGGGACWVYYPRYKALGDWKEADRALAANDLENAQQHLQRCLEVWDTSAECHFLMARTCRRREKYPLAGFHLQKAKQLGYAGEMIDLEKTLARAQTGKQMPEAEKALAPWLRPGNPQEGFALEALATGYFHSDTPFEATRPAGVWAEHFPDNWLAHLWYARGLEISLENELASEQFKAVLRLKPDHEEAQIHLAELLVNLGVYPEALENFEKFLEKHPDHATALLGRARCLRALRPLEEARAALKEFRDRSPRDPDGWLLEGLLELDDNRPEQALPWLLKAEVFKAHDRETNRSVAKALRLLKREDEAREYDRKWERLEKEFQRMLDIHTLVRKNPADVALRLEGAGILSRAGRLAQAAGWYAGVLVLDPRNSEARTGLAEVVRKADDPDLTNRYRSLLPGKTP